MPALLDVIYQHPKWFVVGGVFLSLLLLTSIFPALASTDGNLLDSDDADGGCD